MSLNSRLFLFASTIFLGVTPLWTQSDVLDVVKGKDRVYNLGVDANSTPWLTKSPANGSVSMLVLDKFAFFTYKPTSATFTGKDTFGIAYQLNNTPRSLTVFVTIREPRVIAKPDLFTYNLSAKGEQSLPVTENDEDEGASNKPLIRGITSRNSGLYRLSDDKLSILFTPPADFFGVANFTYVVCNPEGTSCSQATTSVLVPGSRDTMEVFTPLFTPIDLPVPKDFVLQSTNLKGSVKQLGHFQQYTPDANTTGRIPLEFYNPTSNQRLFVHVNVLTNRKNIYAFDDHYALTPGDTLFQANLLENDRSSAGVTFRILSQPRFGRILDATSNGEITYLAPISRNFSGVDMVTYEWSKDNIKETGTAYIRVSQFEPIASAFTFYTTRGAILRVPHNVPVSNFQYTIANSGQGKLEIAGDKSLIYTPPANFTGSDAFSVTYQLRSQRGWRDVSTVNLTFQVLSESVSDPCFGQECVWMGDADNDGIVSLADILPIGRFLGTVNDSKSTVPFTSSWYGKKVADWSAGAGLKYADTNGDGIVSDSDTLAVKTHSGKTHGLVTRDLTIQTFPVRLKGNTTIKPGEALVLDIYMGEKSRPALDLYGFTLSLPVNSSLFDVAKSAISFDVRSWLAFQSPVLSLTQNSKERGVLEASYSRTSGKAADGFGKVGTARIIVIDINGIKPPDGSREIQVKLGGSATATDGAGNTFGLHIEPFLVTIELGTQSIVPQIPVQPSQPGLSPLRELSGVEVFPNPAGSWVRVKTSSQESIQSIQLVNPAGQLVYERLGALGSDAEIPLQTLPNGLYFLRVRTDRDMHLRKLQVSN